MSNRRQRSRRKKVLGISNEVFIRLLIVLMIIAFGLIVLFITNNVVRRSKANKEAEKNQNDVSAIYEDANNHIANLDDYKTNTIVRMTAVGSILQNKNLENTTSNFDSVFENVKKCFKDADFSIGTYSENIETDKQKELAKAVKNSGLGIVNIANNKYIKNVSNLENSLKENEIETVGIYDEKPENRVKIIEKRGIKIAILAYSENDSSTEGDKKSNVYSEDIAKEDLEYAKQNAIVIVTMMNWKNTNANVSDNEKNIAKFLIDNGANAVIGTNSTCPKKMEMIENSDGKKCFVAYSLGNYVTDFSGTNSNMQIALSMQFYVDTDNNVTIYKIEYTPIYMNVSNDKENKYKLYDMKYEIANYDEAQNNLNENVSQVEKDTNEKNAKNAIDKSLYDKMKKAKETLENIIK